MKRRWKWLGFLACVLAVLYLAAVYAPLPWIVRMRDAYLSTALGTQNHQWLATALLPKSVVQEAVDRRQAAMEAQAGLRSQWPVRPTARTPVEVWDRESFLALFSEIKPSSLDAWLRSHPEALAQGWSQLTVNESGLNDRGTEIRTVCGEQVLAVDVPNRLLLVRVEGSGWRGVLAVAKDPSRLSIQASSLLGVTGETAGEIARAQNGVLAMTCSGFEDEDGGTLAGWAMCGGTAYGDAHLPEGNKRLELRQDDLFYICDSSDPVAADCTDAVEFHPALIVDGETVVDSTWSGLQPRVCIGQTDRGEILMLVIEGRIPSQGLLGADLPACAALLQRHSCMQAMNLDGGNSAILWYNGEPVTQCADAKHPEGRKLPTAFVYGISE